MNPRSVAKRTRANRALGKALKAAVWTMVAVCCNAASGEMLLDEDFDGYATGSQPVPPWTWEITPSSADVDMQIDDTISVVGKSAHFVDTTSSAQGHLSQGFAARSHVVVEFYMRSDDDTDEGVFMRLAGDAGNDYTVGFSNGYHNGEAGWIGIHESPAGWIVPQLLPYSPGTWYYVRRELDCATNTGSFYVEELQFGLGNPENPSAYHEIGSLVPNTYVNTIRLSTSGTQGANCYIDQLRVYSKYLLDEDFDSYATGSQPVPPWTWEITPSSADVDLEIDNTVSVVGNSVHFLDTTSSAQGQLSQGFAARSHVVVEYYMRSDDDAYEGVFMRLAGDAGSDYAVNFSNGYHNGEAGWIGIHGSPAGWIVPQLLPYSPDTWYYVRRELDCVTNTGSFYIEELRHELGYPGNPSAYHEIGSLVPNTYVDEIWLSTSGTQGADCYIDELRIWRLFPDCNSNQIPDEYDLEGGDCNTNGVPDVCEADFDRDGLINDCDEDIDDDGVLNEIDVCDYTPTSLPAELIEPDGSVLGDLDGDCDVDLADFAIMQERFTGPNGL